MYRECASCCSIKPEIPEEIDDSKHVVWYEWKSTTETRVRDSKLKNDEFTVKITKKVEEIENISNLTEQFIDDMTKKGMKHLFNIKHQYSVIRSMKENIGQDEVVLHIDFAENYNCKLASEIQSMHFGASRNQVTMHNGVAYTLGKTVSFSTMSSSMRHDPCAIWAYLKPVLLWMKEQEPLLNIVCFISDSPATQYRCK